LLAESTTALIGRTTKELKMEEKISIMDKRAEDLTMRDTLKINAVVLGVIAGATVLYVGGTVAYVKVSNLLDRRRNRRNQENDES
jgi:hypothetical protein